MPVFILLNYSSRSTRSIFPRKMFEKFEK